MKSDVDVSSSALFRLTIRIRSDDTICPNTNALFGPLFSTEANIRYIPSLYSVSRHGQTILVFFDVSHLLIGSL